MVPAPNKWCILKIKHRKIRWGQFWQPAAPSHQSQSHTNTPAHTYTHARKCSHCSAHVGCSRSCTSRIDIFDGISAESRHCACVYGRNGFMWCVVRATPFHPSERNSQCKYILCNSFYFSVSLLCPHRAFIVDILFPAIMRDAFRTQNRTRKTVSLRRAICSRRFIAVAMCAAVSVNAAEAIIIFSLHCFLTEFYLLSDRTMQRRIDEHFIQKTDRNVDWSGWGEGTERQRENEK